MKFERFAGLFAMDREFLSRLDRCFRKIENAEGPYAVASSYAFTDNDLVDSLQVNATSAALTATLPSPTGRRRRRVIKTDVSANTVTVDGSGYLINGSATVVLAAQYDFVEVEPTGNGWLIVNQS